MFARLWSFLRLWFVWKVSDKRMDGASYYKPHCIIMLAFGQQLSEDPTSDVPLPGPANEAIAEVLRFPGPIYPLPPVLAQWEFAQTPVVKQRKLRITRQLGVPETYRNTREVLEQAQQIMKENGWNSATIVAHPWHLVRCIWTAQKLGIRVVNDQYLVDGLNYDANVWNRGIKVPDDQLQTISLLLWLPYELAARLYFWYNDWI